MGLGIWSMHFIGMLAFHLPVEVNYNTALVVLSIIPALISCSIAFYIISRPEVNRIQLIMGAFFIGSGIISMHYLGMGAMKMSAHIHYNPVIWGLSAFIAFAASLTALYLLSNLREVRGAERRKLASAVIMGGAVAGMHYTGMAAAKVQSLSAQLHTETASLNSNFLAYGVVIGILMILILAFSLVRTDRVIKARSAESDRKFQSIIESAMDAIIVSDKDGLIIQWNQGAELIFGYPKEEVIGLNIDMVIPERYKEVHRKGMQRYHETRIPRVIGKTVELAGQRKDGNEFPLEMSLGSWETEEGIFYSSIIRDITERKITEEKISSLVYLDSLTGLPNRRLFNDRLALAIDQAQEHGQAFSILYIDLDHFKLINDNFGHVTGDQLLKEVATRLQETSAKSVTVSRLGGDEFIMLLPNTDYEKAAEHAADLIEVLNKPFQFNGEEVFVTPSVGISIYPEDGEEQETLIKNADIAMYRVKEEGKNSFQFFTQEMNKSVSRKSQLAIGLRKALEKNEFSIHYQPQVDLKTGKIIGAEALLRWNHSEWGSVSPAEFIPIAEETGVIVQIGEYVLKQACLQNKAWQDAGLPPFRIAVNISSRQFSQSDLSEVVSIALEEAQLAPHYLELELTESIIQGSKSAVSTMLELKAKGVHLSIDDFGTGYSSLKYLKMFPINTLKIDQHFTRNINSDLKDAALVDTIIKMAHNLGLNVIAEGVETLDQLEFLKDKSCNQAQGYYFNRPLPADEIERLYKQTEEFPQT